MQTERSVDGVVTKWVKKPKLAEVQGAQEVQEVPKVPKVPKVRMWKWTVGESEGGQIAEMSNATDGTTNMPVARRVGEVMMSTTSAQSWVQLHP